MLQYRFDKIFMIKGILNPFSFLRNAGFSDSFATKTKNNRINRLSLDMLERLCISLECTPNDLLEYTPEKAYSIANDHPLHQLNRTDKIIEINRTLSRLPIEDLIKIQKIIKET